MTLLHELRPERNTVAAEGENGRGLHMNPTYQDRIHIEIKGGVEQVTRPYREGFAAQKLGKRWGFIDESGHLAIKRRFDYCQDFCNGIAAVKIGDKWGFIDRQGTVIHEPCFDDVKSFQGDFAEVKLANQWRTLSRSGEVGETVSSSGGLVQQATGAEERVAIEHRGSQSSVAGRVCGRLLVALGRFVLWVVAVIAMFGLLFIGVLLIVKLIKWAWYY